MPTPNNPNQNTHSGAPRHQRPRPGGPSHPPRPGRSGRRPGSPRFGNRPPRRGKQRVEHHTASDRDPGASARTNAPIPPIANDVVRIVPLGGVEEIGRNMTAIEVGNDI